jgi:hypothetical protein
VWEHEWHRERRPAITLEEPHWHETKICNIYRIQVDGRKILIAAAEFSAGIFGFFSGA